MCTNSPTSSTAWTRGYARGARSFELVFSVASPFRSCSFAMWICDGPTATNTCSTSWLCKKRRRYKIHSTSRTKKRRRPNTPFVVWALKWGKYNCPLMYQIEDTVTVLIIKSRNCDQIKQGFRRKTEKKLDNKHTIELLSDFNWNYDSCSIFKKTENNYLIKV